MKGITCPKCGEYILTAARRKELQALPAKKTNLHKLVSSMYDAQHMRIIFEGRFRATSDNIYGYYVEHLDELEAKIKDDIERQVKLYPIHEWIIGQRGLSYDLAGQLIGLIQDISKFDNVSKLWAYFGLGVIDLCQDCGKRYYPINQRAEKIIHISQRLMEQYEKKIVKEGSAEFSQKAKDMLCSCIEPHIKKVSQKRLTGALIDYNPQAKMVAYKIEDQFVKQGDLYRKLFDQFKAEYALREDLKAEQDLKKGKRVKIKNGETTETKGTGHINQMARRKMVKIFLQHLWITWRTMEKLPVSKPYAIDILGHSDYIEPPSI